MSLHIFVRERDNDLTKFNIIRDIEANFSKVKLGDYKEDVVILFQIERAFISDSNAFIDRFGFKLDSSCLSTGCKAALETVRCKDNEVIDLIECGINARDCIISNCKNGNILISRPDSRISDYSVDNKIDVVINGKRFCSMSEMSQYLEEL